MKKILQFQLIVLLTLAGFQSGSLHGQALSGLYTIDASQATGGTNFQSFNDLESALSTNGISGGVTVNVVPGSGPYNEQVLFSPVSGASIQERVVINGNNNLITFNSTNTSQRYVIGFNGADFFTVNDLQVSGTGTYAYACLLYGGADFNVFSNCSFSVSATGSSSNQMPVVLSGSGTTYASSSNSGNNNTWVGCDMFGGYYGVSWYSSTSAGQYNSGNKIMNCHVRDFYARGISSYYHIDQVISGNMVERPLRTNQTTLYAIYVSSGSGALVEGNTIQKLYEQNQTQTGTTYCLYFTGNTNSTFAISESVIRNNIIRDIRSHSTIYGFRMYYVNGDVFHNTISIDHPTATSGTTYGMYISTTGTRFVNAANNLIAINRGGSSNKYGIYYATTNLVTSDYNNIYMGPAGTNNNAGYFGGAQTTLANLQSATGQEANSQNIDPVFTNATNDLMPTSTTLNDLGTPLGVIFDHRSAIRNQSTPDIGAVEFLSQPCSGTPSQTVVGPDYELCPGETATFTLSNLSPDLGLSYQWRTSTLSNVGPFTVVPGANSVSFTTPPVNVNTWVSAIITCSTNPSNSVSSVAQASVAGTTTNSVPYYESFEAIGKKNRLPNCSWLAPGIGASARTYVAAESNNLLPRTGSAFAAFTNPGSTDHFFTNGIYMEPGITYSAALWYLTDLSGATNWTDLSIMLGTAQSAASLTPIVSTNGPAVAITHKLLSGTFTVSSPGMYYVAVRATSSAGTAENLAWDDLSITIPCSLNTPSVNMVASGTVVCAGENVILTATGADVFTWNNNLGAGSVMNITPIYSGLYTATGTSSATGCSATVSQYITVNPSPVVNVVTEPAIACVNQPVALKAFGADSYMWSTGGTGNTEVVVAAANQVYTVQGTNSYGCTGSSEYTLDVKPLPVVFVDAPAKICVGEQVELNASGANTYEWSSASIYLAGNPVIVSPDASTTYTVKGTDANGCAGTTMISLSVEECLGVSEAGAAGVSVYPNPVNDRLSVQLPAGGDWMIELTDVTGRSVYASQVTGQDHMIDMAQLAPGVYNLHVSGNDFINTVRVIRN